MAITSPEKYWWKPADKEEKLWITIALLWCLVLTIMMPLMHVIGTQNPSVNPMKIRPQDYRTVSEAFIEKYKVGEEKGIPIVEPPDGADVYLRAQAWIWTPILKLKKGVNYKFHISSTDLMHGFSLMPLNMNFQIVPGHDNILNMTPTSAGTFHIICNEFCGIGHHTMIGKIIVS
ncbi:MAG: cytochrome C oxidase subunit II [Deltaproteobacteria bacterium]|nr:cytochrome C oxidase subunit II [Deltaproteobacteria bacterium]